MLFAVGGAGLFALAQSYAMLLIGMAAIGLGCSSVFMGGLYVIGRSNPPERFAALSSLLIGLGSLGNLAGATPLAMAVASIGWRASIGIIAAATAVCVLLIALVLRDPPASDRPVAASLRANFATILRLRPLWPMLPLVLVSYAVVQGERSLWIGPFFGDVYGFDAVARGAAALWMALAMTLGSFAYAPVNRLLGSAKTTVIAGSAATVVVFALLGTLPLGSDAALALVCALGAAGITYVILMSHGRLFFPEHLLGQGVTFLNFLFIGGVVLVQALSGAFVKAALAAGQPPGEVYRWLHSGFALVLALALLVYLRAPARPAPGKAARSG